MTDKPKNKQMLTILTVVGAAIIVWLFLKTELGRKLLQALKNLFGGDSQDNSAGNSVVTENGDTSWLDSLLDALKDASAPFTINIPGLPGYTPAEYEFPDYTGSDYEHPVFNTGNSGSGAGCSFCMKTPEGLPPVSKPAPPPALVLPPPQRMISFGSVSHSQPTGHVPSNFTGLGNFMPW